jgi:hypothetical protein
MDGDAKPEVKHGNLFTDNEADSSRNSSAKPSLQSSPSFKKIVTDSIESGANDSSKSSA